MQENDIYKAKEELANLYIILKLYNSNEVIIIFNKKHIIILQKIVNAQKENLLNELIKTKSVHDLIEEIKNTINIIINNKINELVDNYNNSQLSPAEDYEFLLQKAEQSNRRLISNEHRLRLSLDILKQIIDSLEKEKSFLLSYIVSYIINRI